MNTKVQSLKVNGSNTSRARNGIWSTDTQPVCSTSTNLFHFYNIAKVTRFDIGDFIAPNSQ